MGYKILNTLPPIIVEVEHEGLEDDKSLSPKMGGHFPRNHGYGSKGNDLK